MESEAKLEVANQQLIKKPGDLEKAKKLIKDVHLLTKEINHLRQSVSLQES